MNFKNLEKIKNLILSLNVFFQKFSSEIHSCFINSIILIKVIFYLKLYLQREIKDKILVFKCTDIKVELLHLPNLLTGTVSVILRDPPCNVNARFTMVPLKPS